MLRTIQHPHLRPRLLGIKASDSGTGVLTFGGEDFSSITDNGSADLTLNLKEAFVLGESVVGLDAMFVGTCVDTTPGGSRVARIVSATESAVRVAASAGTDFHGLILGYDNYYADEVVSPGQALKTTRRSPRMMGFKVQGTSTAALLIGTPEATLTDNGTGDYTVTFKRPFNTAPVVVATPLTANRGACIVSSSVNAVRIQTATFPGGALSDADFELLVLGYDTLNSGSRMERAIQAPARKPRFLAFSALANGSALGFGANDAALTDNGTGDYTITFNKPFAREPIVVAGVGTASVFATVSTVSSTAIRILTKTTAGAVANDAIINAFVLGSDVATEY